MLCTFCFGPIIMGIAREKLKTEKNLLRFFFFFFGGKEEITLTETREKQQVQGQPCYNTFHPCPN